MGDADNDTDADDADTDNSSDDSVDGSDSDGSTDSDDANDDLDDDTNSADASASADTDSDSGDDSIDSSDEITNGTSTDDDANSLSSLMSNRGRDSGFMSNIFGQNVDGEDVVMDVTLSESSMANLWGMVSLIVVTCLIAGCLYRRAEAKRVRYELDDSPV